MQDAEDYSYIDRMGGQDLGIEKELGIIEGGPEATLNSFPSQ